MLPSVSQAELGGNAASILSEQQEFNSQLSNTQQGGVVVCTQTLPSGIVIQEYLSGNGTVFAVTWSGPALPNLQILLGSYFKDYLAAIKEARRSIYLNNENVIIQSSGMMGAFQGFAFLSKQAPAGFTPSNLSQ
ncbi:DUF2844 domain-containing protein [Polynucleobacter sp. Ross1-W9]|uniref:DUF2844 domain-containing protein n=1 Tax=Polynucleobacter parvulilacunae TaxID=1855631 RepID=UPI001C0E30A5|nr:DUF2844 domain-containing protein [Polynucleobacter parvulilacunae]MBU3556236.1 DUF2844 domain-containing protein [Polynucleobacter parvulilacunae]